MSSVELTMSEIIDLGMYDEEYLQLLVQGRDPIQEHIYAKNLARAGISSAEATQVAQLVHKSPRTAEEEALIQRVFQQLRSQ